MNYARNTKEWNPGDLVIHDADAKRDDMLMLVLEKEWKDGAWYYWTAYIHQEEGRKTGRWFNRGDALHDPKWFKIQWGSQDIQDMLIATLNRGRRHK